MEKKKILIMIVVFILAVVAISAIYEFYSSHLFNEDGTVADGHQDLINHLKEVEDPEEKEKQIKFALEQNIITQDEADELRESWTSKPAINRTEPNANTTVINEPQNEPDEYVPNRTLDKVSMSIKEGTLTKTNATVVIKDENEDPYWYGRWFRIDKKENGEWKELETTGENYGFTTEGIGVGDDGILELKTDWEKLYGELESGEYRIVKEQYENGRQYFYAEFSL